MFFPLRCGPLQGLRPVPPQLRVLRGLYHGNVVVGFKYGIHSYQIVAVLCWGQGAQPPNLAQPPNF